MKLGDKMHDINFETTKRQSAQLYKNSQDNIHELMKKAGPNREKHKKSKTEINTK